MNDQCLFVFAITSFKLFPSADIENNGPDDIYKAPVHVYSNGQMVWFATVVWQSTCAVDVTWFPVDVQVKVS